MDNLQVWHKQCDDRSAMLDVQRHSLSVCVSLAKMTGYALHGVLCKPACQIAKTYTCLTFALMLQHVFIHLAFAQILQHSVLVSVHTCLP